MKEKPNYYAILDAVVRYDPNISFTAKVIYAEISALTNKEGYAWATNQWFADNFCISASQVSRVINSLKEAGYIRVEVTDKYYRKIYLENIKGVTQKAHTPTQIPQGGYASMRKGVTQKAQDNNTRVNSRDNKDFKFKTGDNSEDHRGKPSAAKEALRQKMLAFRK